MAGFAKPEIRLAQTPGWFDQLAGLLSRELAPSSRKLRTALRLATIGTIGAGLIASCHVNNELGTYIVWLLVGAGPMMSARKATELGLKPMAWVRAYSSAGVDPKIMGMGPVPASQLCLSKAGWTHQQLDLMEINEAFAAQAIGVNRQMGWDTAKINVNGGAIAIGHPIGASGCRILVTLLHEMIRRDAKKGLASLCIGGGMGVAIAIER